MTAHNITDYKLELWLLDELDPKEKQMVDQAIASDKELQEKVAQLKRSNEEILGKFPADLLMQNIQEEIKAEPSFWQKLVQSMQNSMPALATGTMAALVLGFSLMFFDQKAEGPEVMVAQDTNGGQQTVAMNDPDHGIRAKGGEARLSIFKRSDDSVKRLSEGAIAKLGDVIQVGYMSAGHKFGMIVSVDGRGNIFRHYPRDLEKADSLAQDGMVLLDFSYELDDAPKWERFYFIYSNEAFDFLTIESSVKSAFQNNNSTLELPKNLKQGMFELKKDEGK